MMHYDNLEDVKGKLLGTYCYYEGKAVVVKDVQEIEPGQFVLYVIGLNQRAKKIVSLDDPRLNFMHYNIGYSNYGHSAVWWYRIPQKQYRQGLRHDQFRMLASNEAYMHRVEFNFGNPIVNMLENVYPRFEEVEKGLKDREVQIMAFNKDFAMSWDRIHGDFIVEYKGKPIGCMAHINNVRLMEEYNHLTEALKEAVA